MFRKILINRTSYLSFIIAFSLALNSIHWIKAAPISYFLPDGKYNADIPTPEQFLGYELGDWHVRHDQVIAYLKLLAEKSPRVTLQQIGKTWEEKNQLLLIISSEKNQRQLESIKAERHALNSTKNSPLVVWLGYSIHGNEASGTNASLAVAYYLAAAQSKTVNNLLADTVVLIDPSFNPDGYTRFSSWVNANKSLVKNGDSNDREFHEPWPGGRTNHYWFDLNRDWLLAVNPESKNRLKVFHQWHPHVLTDHHEMGTNSSYFFQPGVHQRQNPLTPEQNFKLTGQLAKFHAKALDEIGSEYFSEEGFDDFYPGKGSTYPDLNGGVGILFEQASVRGHYQNSRNGPLKFAFAIRNHVATSLSTLMGATQLKSSLKTYQHDFFQPQKNNSIKGYLFSADDDPERATALAEVMLNHDIKIYALKKPLKTKTALIRTGYIVPLNQLHGKLVQILFDVRKKFKDKTFYDVSAWAMQYAYNLKLQEFKSQSQMEKYQGVLFKTGVSLHKPSKPNTEKQPPVAFIYDWAQLNAAKFSSQLLSQGFHLKVNTRPFTFIDQDTHKKITASAGNVILYLKNQSKNTETIAQDIVEQAVLNHIKLHALSSGLTPTGIDLGSPSIMKLALPRVALLTGDGINPYEAGEVRYVLEQKLGIPVTRISASQISSKHLKPYTHLILVDGRYTHLKITAPQKINKDIQNWIQQGGIAIGIKQGAQWLSQLKDTKILMTKTTKEKIADLNQKYQSKADNAAEDIIGGAIFSVKLDTGHPLAFGYKDNSLAVFKNAPFKISEPEIPYAVVARYTKKPLISGYSSDFNLQQLSKTPMLVTLNYGDGKLILFDDDPNFRGYWLGSMKLFINSLFFANLY